MMSLVVAKRHDPAMEVWLREQVVPAAQALKAVPERPLSAGQVREHLAKKRRSRTLR